MRKFTTKKLLAGLPVLILLVANLVYIQNASAAFLTQTSVLLTNMNAGGASAIIFKFHTSAGNTGTGLTISFPTYTGGSNGAVNATQTVATTYSGTNCTSIT